MEILERLDAEQLRAVVQRYRDALRLHQEALNRLNVYPVPDGDTGTNMALTVESVVAEIGAAVAMPEVCRAISHGSLMGARGNSGVILSQILRGMATVFEPLDGGKGPDLARALSSAAAAAYTAVMRPVEGTILTVARAAGEAAEAAAEGTVAEVLEAAHRAAAEALARTPELLPVLKKAGVVDAGGAGFVLLLEAFLQVVAGREVAAPPLPEGLAEPLGAGSPAAVAAAAAAGGGGDGAVADLRYEVMFLLEAADAAVPAFKAAWAELGDSIVVVGGDGTWNCHVHTDDAGAAIEAALDFGRPRRIRITDLADQVEEERWVRQGWGAPEVAAGPEPVEEPVRCAVVAVATGEGLGRIFGSLGVQRIVAGGQSMNPSTAQILQAVEAAPAAEVVVLPNNKNIVPVARQVDGLTPKVVRVAATTSVAEGFAALMAYDAARSAEENAEAMAAAAAETVSGEITRAVRSCPTEAGPVEEGDYLGLSRSRIVVADPTLAGAATALLGELVGDHHEVVTVIEGEGSTPGDTDRITAWLAERRPGVTAEVLRGDQLLYPYYFSVE
ncbi:MAG TPA: DAK2 domain-containing protein [Acidimicrobiales bacterium]|nr:DAK2 domain-containing protein [Acidimicrobiales bacterium]